MNSLLKGIKAARDLGIRQVLLYGLYSAGLKTGYWRLRTPANDQNPDQRVINQALCNNIHLFPTPDPNFEGLLSPEERLNLINEADDIVAGKYRPFGGEAVSLNLSPPLPLKHWCEVDDGREDLKLYWEPARFGWVFTLTRAYHLTGDEQYPNAFWNYLEFFHKENPVNLGANWASAQEVALRLIEFIFAYQFFTNTSGDNHRRQNLLLKMIYQHARRIPVTLIYARAQNNNHLLTEALGLYAAGIFLEQLPEAKKWRKTGWMWLNRGFQTQISDEGSYSQHSMNYHRLMVQVALLGRCFAKSNKDEFPPETMNRLNLATRWLLVQMDPVTGNVPNLGHNDGSHILPLSSGGFSDYRPAGQAASRCFLNTPCLPSGKWDELSLWLGIDISDNLPIIPTIQTNPCVLELRSQQSHAIIRAEHLTSRPAHADQLHVDIWWKHQNIAMDPGTYRYTDQPPWNNGLTHTACHNTIQMDGQDQMTWTGRFLWLDWAQGRLVTRTEDEIQVEHDGYKRLGIIHRRCLACDSTDNWQVYDEILPITKLVKAHSALLNWALPDLQWQIDGSRLTLNSGDGQIVLEISAFDEKQKLLNPVSVNLIRAGELLHGEGKWLPTAGWFSPTYNVKVPTLSFQVTISAKPPFTILSRWKLIG